MLRADAARNVHRIVEVAARLLAGARAVAEGALSHEDAPGVVFATLLDGLRAGGEER